MNRNFWTALLVFAGFIPLEYFIERQALFDLLNALSIVVGFGVALAYLPGAWEGATLPPSRLERGHYLVMGVFVVVVGMTAHRSMLWYWRVAGMPKALLDSAWVAFALYVVVTGYAVHLTSRTVLHGRVPAQGWFRLAIWVAVAVVLTLLTLQFLR